MPRATETGRRQAIPRRSALHGRSSEAGNKGPSAPSIGAFTGFVIDEEEEAGPDPNDWFLNKENHLIVTEDFKDV